MSCKPIRLPDGTAVIACLTPGAKLTTAEERALAEYARFCRERAKRKGRGARARGRRAMILPANTDHWPIRQRDDYFERWAHREFDGGQPTEEARVAAEAEMRASVAGNAEGQQSLEGME